MYNGTNNPTIRTIVFDFGNVIGYFSHLKAAEQLAARSRRGVSAEDIRQFLFYTDLEPTFEVGRLSGLQVLARLRRQFDLEGSDNDLRLAFSDMFWPNPDACALVPRLRGRYRLMLLSNTNELHYPHFRRQFADTLRHFDTLLASHELGMRKPDPLVFHHARQLAGCPAAECLFIDDLPANVEAARACGWRGIVYGQGADLGMHLREAGIAV